MRGPRIEVAGTHLSMPHIMWVHDEDAAAELVLETLGTVHFTREDTVTVVDRTLRWTFKCSLYGGNRSVLPVH